MEPPFDLKSIKPGEFAYLTKRKLKNRRGEERGEIFVWRKRGREENQYLLRCPFCQEKNSGKAVFNRRPYRIRCPSCSRSIALTKLLTRAKKSR